MSEQKDLYIIPYDVDPPITIDGKLDDWENVPNAIVLNKKEQVTYQVGKAWTGPDDLSGTIRLAWRDGFYIAAEVTDDVVQQPYSGAGIYKGDHINLWIDFKPTLEPERVLFGEGQYHIAVSPGNFEGTAGAQAIPPEIVIYYPEGLPSEGGEVAARRTEKGYVIEAFIPFSRLKIETPKKDQYAAFEVAIGESDSSPARQETFITRGTKPWHYLRSRMMPMVFGSGSGKAVLPSRRIPIPGVFNIQKKAQETVKFTIEAIDPAYEPFLFFRGRMDCATVAGYGGQVTVDLNGNRIRGQRLSNRPMTATMEDNREQIIATNDGRITLPSAPDYTRTDTNKTGYALRSGVKAAEFEFYVGGLLKEGENTIVFSHVSGHPKHSFISIGDVELRVRPPVPGEKFLKSAPSGELLVYEPQTSFPRTYSGLRQENGRILLVVGKDTYSLESRFSTPDRKWQTGSASSRQAGTNKFFSHARKVIEHDEWIEVRDTFRNLTGENLPIMQQHDLVFAKGAEGVWLSGIKKPFKTGCYTRSENPSVFATALNSGVGLAPLNDEFMVHAEQSAKDGVFVRLADPAFVLKAGGEYTAEWAIVPVPKPDYYAFVNAARRMLDANFTLKWTSAFLYAIYNWSDATFKEFIDNKSANLLIQGNQVYILDPKNYADFYERVFSKTYEGKYKNVGIRGTSFLMYPPEQYVTFQKRMRRLYPDGSKKTAIYFHFFLDTYEPNNVRFASDRGLDANGNHVDYGGGASYCKLFIPTLENGWGKEQTKVIDKILDEIGADGLYVDEFSWSKVRYVYNMLDGCSADIDPATHKIKRLKGSAALLSRDYRAYHVKRVLDRGCPFIINGQPLTRTLRRLKFQAFVETGSGPGECMRTHLYSPVILGDHLTEDTYKEIYQNMLTGLDHGCLYAYYYIRFLPNKTLAEYMYPFTPIELHEGYVIGKERILTNRSGLFGWGDNSDFKAHVYDRDSKETDGSEVKKIQRNGKTYAEVRIPEGYSAAIVRK